MRDEITKQLKCLEKKKKKMLLQSHSQTLLVGIGGSKCMEWNGNGFFDLIYEHGIWLLNKNLTN